MSTSGGGGYCDCGDPEAWKTEPVCDVHKATKSQSVGLVSVFASFCFILSNF